MSHLYTGFRHVGKLRSIAQQRAIQMNLLREISYSRSTLDVLSIGVGYGEELDAIFGVESGIKSYVSISAIDEAASVNAVNEQPFSSLPNIHLDCVQCDLRKIESLHDFGLFDIVQIGFVLHDFDYDEKDEAVRIVTAMTKPGGHVILSEIFSDSTPPETEEIVSIYDRFLLEADVAKESGRLGFAEWEALVGANSSHAGLLKTREDAAKGRRDYFETVDRTCARLQLQGMTILKNITNELHSNLSVIVAKR